MSIDERIVMRLEVDRGADPITGTLTQPGHAGQPFTGWLALTDAIELIRGAALEAPFLGDVKQREVPDEEPT